MDSFYDVLNTDNPVSHLHITEPDSAERYGRFYLVVRPLFDFFFIHLLVRLQIFSCVCPVVMSVRQGTAAQKRGPFLSIAITFGGLLDCSCDGWSGVLDLPEINGFCWFATDVDWKWRKNND